MKFLIVALVVACAHARPDVSHIVRSSEADTPIVRSSYDITPEGNFNYAYETGNGIVAQADGVVKDANSDHPAVVIKGSYGYTSPEGEHVELTYVADENGYQPQGSHIPQAPPVPEYIARSLQYIESHVPKVIGGPAVVANSAYKTSRF